MNDPVVTNERFTHGNGFEITTLLLCLMPSLPSDPQKLAQQIRDAILSQPFEARVTQGAAVEGFATLMPTDPIVAGLFPSGVRARVKLGDLLSGTATVQRVGTEYIAFGQPAQLVSQRVEAGFKSAVEVPVTVPEEKEFSPIKFLYIDSNELFVFDGEEYRSLGTPFGFEGAIANTGSATTAWNGWVETSGSARPYIEGVAQTDQSIDAQADLLAIGQGWGLSFPFGSSSADGVTGDVTQDVSQISLSNAIATQIDGTVVTEELGSGYPNWSQSTSHFTDESAQEAFSMAANNNSARDDFQNNGPFETDRPYCPRGAGGVKIHIMIPLTKNNNLTPSQPKEDDWTKGLNSFNLPALTPFLSHTVSFLGSNGTIYNSWENWQVDGLVRLSATSGNPANPDNSVNSSNLLPCGFDRSEWGQAGSSFSEVRLYTRTYVFGVEDFGGPFDGQFGQTYQSFEPCTSEGCVNSFLNNFLAVEVRNGPLDDVYSVVEFDGEFIEGTGINFCGSNFQCPVDWNGPPPPPPLDNLPNFYWEQILLRSFEGALIHAEVATRIEFLPEEEDEDYIYIFDVKFYLGSTQFKNTAPVVYIPPSGGIS
ncbi:MAG: hypothetical protein AAGD25_06710 [Cyanobacteria bacterium P01_F01_bin.150]